METEYLNSEPTECPNNPAHEIDTDSICIIKTAEVKVQYSFAFWRGTNPYIEIDSTSWSTVAAFRYLGSDACPITKVICIVSRAGTTGTSKGVTLSHNNFISQVLDLYHIFPVDDTSKCLSYLPVSHVYERTNLYVYQYLGVSIYYAQNMGTIADNLKEISPEMLTTVPRLLEKVYDKIVAKGMKLKGVKRALFFWALNLGLKYEIDGKNGWFYELQLSIANKLIFNKWREALGSKMRVIVSGGAALQPRLARVFTAARIPVLEGYGLTETSPVIAVNSLEKGGLKFGTVGKPLENVKVKIAEDAEILCKGPNLMEGYYKDPEMTKEAIDKDGWFHTGDQGRIEPEGHIKITGRKKAIFKTER